MSKQGKEIKAKPFKEAKVMKKKVNQRFRQIERKIVIDAKQNDPYGVREKFKQNMLYGKSLYDKLEG